jgi:hypothetical protein
MIFRPIAKQHLDRLEGGWRLGLIHGFDLRQNEADWSRADRLIPHKGIQRWRYFNVWQLGDRAWDSPWFNFERETVSPLTALDGREAIDPWYKRRLWDWPQVDGETLEKVLTYFSEHQESSIGVTHPWLDMVFLRPHYWMFGPDGARYDYEDPPGSHNRKSDFHPMMPVAWEKRMQQFLGRQVRRDALTILNAPERLVQDVIPGVRVYLEKAQWDWERALGIWLDPKMHILSVDAVDTEAVEKALRLYYHRAETHWISFDGPVEGPGVGVVDDAYREAERIG